MLGVLGLDPLAEPWAAVAPTTDLRDGGRRPGSRAALARPARRPVTARDYAAADAIRDHLQAAGVLIEDTPEGPRWELKR
jgi:cysteinyl-tRNA synthetase